MNPIGVLVTVSGRDRPGVTAALFSSFAAHDVDVVDVEQVVIRERVILGVVLDLRGDPASLRRSVGNTCSALGMEHEVVVVEQPDNEPAATVADGPSTFSPARLHVIVLGRPLRPGALADVAQRIADVGGNIESVTQLSSYPVSSLEMMVADADAEQLRAVLVRAASDTGLDIAVEPAGLARRAKRLVVLDVDSTLVQGEGIDELAKLAGVAERVAAITASAMAGSMDFGESLAARVSLLAGLSESEVHRVRDGLVLTPGARTLVRTLKRLGYAVGVVSGGFTVLTDRFVDELELDFAAANELEIIDGRVTGRVIGPVVDRAGKASALRRFAGAFNVPLSQTVAIGDGANDIDMLRTAGLGIAFNAKAALRESAEVAVNQPFLDVVLYILGISRSEIEAADAGDGPSEGLASLS
ncbi:phosphoserine phosphatase SerB [Jatrophihabitans telluris]|uniref:phosphoserine phosphatase n=1 Tax=Jatrophihabitans telluris TaxID=2038343 RepID=A0ABY4QWB4_9ACTN|nr:phosphoserine phosphatase SerB [Jatrophihabitans telluris]UQX87584.1 phosphoserine phosphatase SerB [Jatrophihabitans telluris]